MIDSQFTSFILSRPGVTDILGTRLYPAPLPRSKEGKITAVFPAATYQDISEQTDYASGEESGFYVVRYQVDVFHSVKETAVQVANLIRTALSGFQGNMSGGVHARVIKRVNGFSRYVPEVQLYRVVADYQIKFVKEG